MVDLAVSSLPSSLSWRRAHKFEARLRAKSWRMADVPSPEGSPSRLRRDPSFSLGGNIDAFYKGASAAIAAAFVATAELMKPDMARE